MALLPPFSLDAVVALGVGDDPAQRVWIGTGFLYGAAIQKKSPDPKRYVVFLVTNRHVLEGQSNIWIKFNPATGSGSQDFKISLRAKNGRYLWIAHPDSAVDLGAIFINAQILRAQSMRFNYFRDDEHTFTLAQLGSEGVAEGDGVFVLGYPMGLVDAGRQTAICRSGCIARIQDVIAAGVGDFLIDAAVFPGNSGGPVILRPEAMSITGTKAISKANLVGVVQSYLPYQDVAISRQTGRQRITFDENSGLCSVIPVDRINELMVASIKRLRGRIAQATWKAKHLKSSTRTTAST